MNIEIDKKFIKISKDNIIVRMDFVTDIDESKIDWYLNDLTQQLENELKLQKLYSNNKNQIEQSYSIKRQNEYPNIKDQLDMLYWDLMNGTDKWRDKITEIKTKYPKPDLK